MPQLVVDPEASSTKQHEFIFAEPVEDALKTNIR
jgi:hypothetical protein